MDDMGWIDLAQDREQGRALVNTQELTKKPEVMSQLSFNLHTSQCEYTLMLTISYYFTL
jgi:hypothetical protein